MMQGATFIYLSEQQLNQLVKQAAQAGVNAYREEQIKTEKLTVAQVAEQEQCSKPTVINWINVGVNNIRLRATKKGKRDYLISRYDLNQFLLEKAKKTN